MKVLKTVYEYEYSAPRKKSAHEKDIAYAEFRVSGFSLAVVMLLA